MSSTDIPQTLCDICKKPSIDFICHDCVIKQMINKIPVYDGSYTDARCMTIRIGKRL